MVDPQSVIDLQLDLLRSLPAPGGPAVLSRPPVSSLAPDGTAETPEEAGGLPAWACCLHLLDEPHLLVQPVAAVPAEVAPHAGLEVPAGQQQGQALLDGRGGGVQVEEHPVLLLGCVREEGGQGGLVRGKQDHLFCVQGLALAEGEAEQEGEVVQERHIGSDWLPNTSRRLIKPWLLL